MAAESTSTELKAYITTNFVSGTGAFKMTTLVTFLENLVESLYIAIGKTSYISLTAAEAPQTFSTPFSAGSTYQLVWWAFDASGNSVACKITNMTVSGFTVQAATSCTFHYYAIKNN